MAIHSNVHVITCPIQIGRRQLRGFIFLIKPFSRLVIYNRLVLDFKYIVGL